MADDNLNIKINVDPTSSEGNMDDVISTFVRLKGAMADAASASTATTQTITEGAGDIADAADAAASAQGAAAASMVGALRTVSAAQEQVVADLQARFASELAAHEELTNQEVAQRLRWLENERQMGRMSLEDEQARLSELLALTEANTAQRIAAERTVQLVYAEIVQQSIADYRAEAEAGVISADQQIAALRSIADEAEYSLKVRSLASDEISRIEATNAKEAAAAVVAAQREERAAAAETAAEMKEASYVAMDVGYGLQSVGLKGGKTLADLSYLARDFTAAGAGMVLQMGAIGVAVAAVTAGVELYGKGIKDSEAEQADFASMRVAIESQGGSWDQARESLEAYATELQNTSTYSKGEALDALNQLIARNLTAEQAEQALTAAANLASAEHLKLDEVVKLLTSAEGARAQALERYDPQLKALIDRHASLHEIVLQVARDYDGQLSSAMDTNEGASVNLENEIQQLGTDMANFTAGPLGNLITNLDDIVRGLEQATDAASKFSAQMALDSSTITNSAGAGYGYSTGSTPGKDLGGFGNAPGDDMFARFAHSGTSPYDRPTGRGGGGDTDSKEFENALRNVQAYFAAQKIGYSEAMAEEDALRTKYKLTAEQLDEITRAELRLTEAQGRRDAAATRAADSEARRAERQATAAPKDFGSFIADKPSADDGKDAETKLNDILKALTDSEGEYTRAVKSASTAEEQHAAKLALSNKEHVDAVVAVNLLNDAIYSENQGIASATAEQTRHTEAADALKNAYNTLLASVRSKHSATTQEQEDLKNLKAAYDLHNTAATDAGTAIKKLTADLSTNRGLMDTYRTKVEAVADALKLLGVEAEQQTTVNQLNDLNSRFADDQKQKAREQDLLDEIATYGKSLAQQLAYYEQRYAQEVAADGAYTEQAQATADKIMSIELDEYKQREEQHQQMVQAILDQESTLIDGIISKHEGLKGAIHSIWQQIGADIEKRMEASLTGPGSLFGGLGSLLGGGGIGGPGGAGTAGANASTAGIFGSFFGASGSTSIASALPANSGIFGLMFGSSAAAAAAASGGGGAAGSASPGGAGVFSAGVGDPAGAYGSPSSGGGGFSLGSLLSGIKGPLGGALQGAGYGQLIGSLDGGNSLDGSIGGALGGAVGTIFGGPLGGAIGGAAGGLLGSLFGPKNQNAYGEPDIYDTQNYGSTIADLLGTAGANGQNFYESSTVKSLFNGQTALAGLEEVLSQGQASFTQNTGLSASVYQSLLSEIGSSATGSGQLSFGTNIGNLSVSGASGAGGTFRYTDFENLLNEYINAIQGKGGNNAIPTFSVTRSYQNPGIVNGVVSDGSFTPTAANLLGTVAGTGTVTGSIDPTSGTIVGKTPAAATVQVTINGNVVGPGGLTGIAQDIATVLGRLQAGQIVGSGATSSPVYLSRFAGGS